MHKIDSKYFIDGLVQVMIPVTDNCILIGPNGIQFNSKNGKILKNEYLENSKSHVFPFYDTPIHSDEHGTFSNQLFELNKQYLSIYKINDKYKFRSEYFFMKDGIIYSTGGAILDFENINSERVSLDNFRQNLYEINSDYLYVIDNNGKIQEFSNNINKGLPSSGVVIYGNNNTINLMIYNINISFIKKTSVTMQILRINNNELLNIGDVYMAEPNIKSAKR